MCGIVGYIGNKPVYDILITGLKKLEYRGYDSAGVMIYDKSLLIKKSKGKVADLESLFVNDQDKKGSIGMGHTRWATHGAPNQINSHPHVSNSGEISLVHNGIIENYHSLKSVLLKKGYVFKSDTDSEVLVNLIEDIKKTKKIKLGKATYFALKQVVGAYAIAVFDSTNPTEIITAKLGSPLAIGVGESEYYIGSDPSPFLEFTKRCIYLNDNEMAIINLKKGLTLRDIKKDSIIDPFIEELKHDIEEVEKGGYDHFMLKEIFEQPKSIKDTFRGRLLSPSLPIKISSIEMHFDKFRSANRIIFISCGTSWHASLLAEYYFEELIRIPVKVEYASEFRYRNPVINKGDIVIPVSQSGETADTLAAIKMAKEKGAFLYGICNVVGSTIARETDTGVYTHAGSEIGVASTKAFSCQISLLLLMALDIGKRLGRIEEIRYQKIIKELAAIPKTIESVLSKSKHIEDISENFLEASNFIYLGRGYHFPIALEGALKLKEISYIHAEGYPAAEMKHGPIALIDKYMPVVIIATNKSNYHKVVSNIMEIKARGGRIIAIVSSGDTEVKKLAEYTIEIPNCDELIAPILANIPLQLLSYYIANKKGCNIDQPRNLAKSVTVE
ncbi:MAG: glutamine--fructose-6-phosphate transaminase (isomerizing) [Bacteroidetes bacterium]|nr:glutamine--fructose-6-phosphate transaminase (isomerizing) [Bacteroidota bacterium]MDA1019892.1 glutamine--fructose-6-phosphate transaminase (isomerizing) [Bacteroidota bacterium]